MSGMANHIRDLFVFLSRFMNRHITEKKESEKSRECHNHKP